MKVFSGAPWEKKVGYCRAVRSGNFKLSLHPSQDELFLWVLHVMGEGFKEQAILRGGMVLRLLKRDLYDVYFYQAILKVAPDRTALDARLSKFESRLPSLKKIKKMNLLDLCEALLIEVNTLTEKRLEQELAPLLPTEELKGLDKKIAIAIRNLVEKFREGRF